MRFPFVFMAAGVIVVGRVLQVGKGYAHAEANGAYLYTSLFQRTWACVMLRDMFFHTVFGRVVGQPLFGRALTWRLDKHYAA